MVDSTLDGFLSLTLMNESRYYGDEVFLLSFIEK